MQVDDATQSQLRTDPSRHAQGQTFAPMLPVPPRPDFIPIPDERRNADAGRINVFIFKTDRVGTACVLH